MPTAAPIGMTPPPKPFPSAIRSGTTPSCSQQNIFPLRPIPLWTSSKTSIAPYLSQISRAAARYPGGATLMPPSPWIGSMTTAAILSPEKSPLETTIRRASTSPNGTCVQRLSGRKGSRKIALEVPPSEPSDLPWKAPMQPTKFCRPVVRIAILRHASTDSVPELVKNEYWRSPGVTSATSRAR